MISIKTRSLIIVLSAIYLSFAGTVYADQTESAEVKITRAITAGHAGITGKATTLDVDGTVFCVKAQTDGLVYQA